VSSVAPCALNPSGSGRCSGICSWYLRIRLSERKQIGGARNWERSLLCLVPCDSLRAPQLHRKTNRELAKHLRQRSAMSVRGVVCHYMRSVAGRHSGGVPTRFGVVIGARRADRQPPARALIVTSTPILGRPAAPPGDGCAQSGDRGPLARRSTVQESTYAMVKAAARMLDSLRRVVLLTPALKNGAAGLLGRGWCCNA